MEVQVFLDLFIVFFFLYNKAFSIVALSIMLIFISKLWILDRVDDISVSLHLLASLFISSRTSVDFRMFSKHSCFSRSMN